MEEKYSYLKVIMRIYNRVFLYSKFPNTFEGVLINVAPLVVVNNYFSMFWNISAGVVTLEISVWQMEMLFHKDLISTLNEQWHFCSRLAFCSIYGRNIWRQWHCFLETDAAPLVMLIGAPASNLNRNFITYVLHV